MTILENAIYLNFKEKLEERLETLARSRTHYDCPSPGDNLYDEVEILVNGVPDRLASLIFLDDDHVCHLFIALNSNRRETLFEKSIPQKRAFN